MSGPIQGQGRKSYPGTSNIFFFRLNLTKLEVRSLQRAHSGLFRTGRVSFRKWQLEKLGAAGSWLGQAGRAPWGEYQRVSGVPIGTVSRILKEISHTRGPHTFSLWWACEGRCLFRATKLSRFPWKCCQHFHKTFWVLWYCWQIFLRSSNKFWSIFCKIKVPVRNFENAELH